MNLRQYIFNRNYQQSKKAPIYNLNISILVAVDDLGQLSMDDCGVLQQNGIEVLFLFFNRRRTIPAAQIEKLPLGNWMIFSCEPTFLITSFLKDIQTEITRDYVLLVDNIKHLSALTNRDMSMLASIISHYHNYFVTYDCIGSQALLFSKKDINKVADFAYSVCGLNNESITIIKRALELSGLREFLCNPDDGNEVKKDSKVNLYNKGGRSPFAQLEYAKYQYFEKISVLNSSDGISIVDKIYDYHNKKQTFTRLLSYLEEFLSYEICDFRFYENKFQKIVLVQSHNEVNNVTDFFDNIASFFDGIIMLDDESTDGTFEKAVHEKLLLKVRKKRDAFLDIDNRNILLALSSFYPVEWICFMDFDERINLKFANFSFLDNNQIDTVAFNVIHLWNNSELFNASFPGTYKGVEKVFRMFRNIGYSQIKSNKKFHFAVTPYFGRQSFDSGILIMHHGFLYETYRKQKYEFYTKNDPLAVPNQYNFLIQDCHLLKRIDSLLMEDILDIDYNNYLKK